MLMRFGYNRLESAVQGFLAAPDHRRYLGVRAADLGQLDHKLLVDWLKRSACFLLLCHGYTASAGVGAAPPFPAWSAGVSLVSLPTRLG